MTEPLLVTVQEAMRLSGDRSRTTIYRKITTGRLDAVKDGRITKITYASLKRDAEALPKAHANVAEASP